MVGKREVSADLNVYVKVDQGRSVMRLKSPGIRGHRRDFTRPRGSKVTPASALAGCERADEQADSSNRQVTKDGQEQSGRLGVGVTGEAT